MRIIFISLILIFLFSVSAEGSDWELICVDDYGKNIWYIYKESIKHPSKNVVRAWMKAVCLKDCDIGSKYIEKAMNYLELDCKKRKFKFLHITEYYTDGTNQRGNDSYKWDYIIPDTILECIHKYLCKDR